MMPASIHGALALVAASPVLAALIAFAITLLTRLVPGPIALVAIRLAAQRDRSAVRNFVAAAALAEAAVLSLAALGCRWIGALLGSDPRLHLGLAGALLGAVGVASLARRKPPGIARPAAASAWRAVWHGGMGVGVTLALPSTWAWWAACGVAMTEARLPLAACWLGATVGLATWAVLLDAGAERLAGLAGAFVRRFDPDHGAVGNLDPAGAVAGLLDGPELVE